MRDGKFTDDEFEAAKKAVINSYRGISDSAGGLVSWYIGRMLAGINTSPEEAIALIEEVTPADVCAAAKTVTLDTVYFMRGTLKEGGNENVNE